MTNNKVLKFKLRWHRGTIDKIVCGESDFEYDTYFDALHSIKVLHGYTNQPYELNLIYKDKSCRHFQNPKTGTVFIINMVFV